MLYLAGDFETRDILPRRLVGFGADRSRVAGLEEPDWEYRPHKEIRMFSLAHDIERIYRTLNELEDCRLVVIDPLTAFLDGINANQNMDARRLLTRLSSIAEEYGTAVLVISHFRKAAAASVLYRQIGSLAFSIASRTVLALLRDPSYRNRCDRSRRLLLPCKNALVPEDEWFGRAFTVSKDALHWEEGRVHYSPDELHQLIVSGLATQDRESQVALWLRKLLAAGPLPATRVQELARAEQIPGRLLDRAKGQAGVRSVHDGKGGRWVWEVEGEELGDWSQESGEWG